MQSSRRLELRRLQHRIRTRPVSSVGLAAAGYFSAGDFQRLQSRISFIFQDVGALGRSCSGETALDFQIVDVSHIFHRPLASSFDWEPPATAIRRPATPCPQTTPKAVVSIASSSGAQGKRKSSFGLLSATRAAKLYENRIDDQGHEGAICGGSQKSEAQA